MNQVNRRWQTVQRLGSHINALLRHVGLKLTRAASHEVIDMRTATQDPVEAFYRAEGHPFILDIPLEYCRNLHPAAFSCADRLRNPFVSTLVSYETRICNGY